MKEKMFKTILIFSLFSFAKADLLSLTTGIHKCYQGHKCIYYRGGSLLNQINDPGYHSMLPLITSNYNIQTTWQTDKLNNVLCGSSQGGKAYLDIEVVNKLDSSKECIIKTVGEHTIEYDKPLIFDYIPSEVAQFCKNYTLDDIVIREFDKLDEVLLEKLKENVKSYGLENCVGIKKVRINRPKLDDRTSMQFEAIEHEMKDKELTKQKKETEKIRLESQLQREIMDKERLQKTSEIDMNIQKMKIESEAVRQKIIDEMHYEKNKKIADAEKYRLEKISEGNELLFSNPNYIVLEGYKAAHNNAKLIFGDIPQNALFNLGESMSEPINRYVYETMNKTYNY